MNINEYVKGKKFSDLSTDGYDWSKWCADNSVELERRITTAGLENCERNGRILIEYAEEQNIPVTIDALFQVIDDPRYSGRLVRIPPPPVAPVPAPTVAGLGYTRKKLIDISVSELKSLLHNSAIGDVADVQRQINEILASEASTSASFQGSGSDRLYQLGIRAEKKKHGDDKQTGPSDADRDARNLQLRREAYDKRRSEIQRISVQGYGGRINHAATEQKIAEELAKLGARP